MTFALRTLDGYYLEAFDPDWQPPDRTEPGYPCGLAEWTSDPAQALTFDSMAALLVTYQCRSVVVPTRPDGKPNRPLTGYTVEVVTL